VDHAASVDQRNLLHVSYLLYKRVSSNCGIREKGYPPRGRQEKPGNQLDVRTVRGHHKHAPTRKLYPVLRTECVEKVLAQAGVGEVGGRHGVRCF
jgi:hypothetical protein